MIKIEGNSSIKKEIHVGDHKSDVKIDFFQNFADVNNLIIMI